jgi:hypothetical protein
MAHQHQTRRRNGIKRVPWTTCVIADNPEKLALYDAVEKHHAAHGGHTSVQTCWCGAQKFTEANGGSMVSGRWVEPKKEI